MNSHYRSIKNEQGAALVVCLVTLLIITIIAASGISTASLQQKMAANIQQQNETFQATESGIDRLINVINGTAATAGDSVILNSALNTPTTSVSYANGLSRSGSNEITVITEVNFLANMAALRGNSLDADENSTIIPGYRFIVTGQATMPSGASTQIEHGIQYD